MIAVTTEGISPALSQVVLQSESKRYDKTIANSFATHCTHDFSLTDYSCELNLTGTVGKVELISFISSTFTTAVCESWNVSDKYTWDNDEDLKQLFMDQTLSEDNRSD